MNRCLNFACLTGVAALGFVLGSQSTDLSNAATAAPQDAGTQRDQGHDQEMPGMSADMMAAMAAAGTPGPWHKHLERMVGDWEGTYRMWMSEDAPAMEMPGHAHREWTLDGRFIKETVTSEGPWGSFLGYGYLGYDNMTQQYTSVWLDNMSTGIWTESGAFDPETGIFRMFGEHRDPATGRMIPMWSEVDCSKPDVQTVVGWAIGESGKPYKHFAGEFTRVKSKMKKAAAR